MSGSQSYLLMTASAPLRTAKKYLLLELPPSTLIQPGMIARQIEGSGDAGFCSRMPSGMSR